MEHSMIRNSNIFTSLCVVTVMILISNPAAADDPREIIRDMEQNVRGDASYNEMTMETVRPRYTREISLRSWTLGDDYSLIYITAPARDRGTAFLKRGNEIWNYQPQVDRTIRMPPSMMSQSWMGSDFTNDDLVGAASLIEDYTHELVGTETVDGHECYVIEMIPEPENPIVYEKVIYWVSKEHRLPVKVKNYDERDELVNSIHFREIKEMGGRMLPTLLEMIPADEDNRKTVLRTTKADFEINIAERFFSIENLTEVR
jgi:outer membrane lipoprotein-sorting protein